MPARGPGWRWAPRRAWSSGCCPTTRQNRDDFELITLKDGDRVVGAVQLAGEDARAGVHHLDAQLLRFARRLGPAAGPGGRRHGRASGWRSARPVVWFGAVGRWPRRRGRRRRRRRRLRRRGGHRGGQRGRPARAPGPPASRSPRYTSTRPRAGPPAGCAATGSSRARTLLVLAWAGPAPGRGARPKRASPVPCRPADGQAGWLRVSAGPAATGRPRRLRARAAEASAGFPARVQELRTSIALSGP